jgi:hypothetical protein
MADESTANKAVHTFELGEDDESPTIYAFMHGLNDPDLIVQVLSKRGQPKGNVKYTIQDSNVVIVESGLGFNNGDRIVVRK